MMKSQILLQGDAQEEIGESLDGIESSAYSGLNHIETPHIMDSYT